MSFEQVNHLNIFKKQCSKITEKSLILISTILRAKRATFFYEFSRQKSQKCLIWIFMPKNNPNLSNIWIFALKMSYIVDRDFYAKFRRENSNIF